MQKELLSCITFHVFLVKYASVTLVEGKVWCSHRGRCFQSSIHMQMAIYRIAIPRVQTRQYSVSDYLKDAYNWLLFFSVLPSISCFIGKVTSFENGRKDEGKDGDFYGRRSQRNTRVPNQF